MLFQLGGLLISQYGSVKESDVLGRTGKVGEAGTEKFSSLLVYVVDKSIYTSHLRLRHLPKVKEDVLEIEQNLKKFDG